MSVFEANDCAKPTAGGPRAAAWTAAGMLSPIAEMESGGTLVRDLGRRSLSLWREIDAVAPVGLALTDSVMVCHAQDTGSAQRVLRLLEEDREHVKRMEPEELKALAPEIKGTLHAWRLLGEGHLYPSQAMQSLYQASAHVKWNFSAPIQKLSAGSITCAEVSEQFDCVIDARGTGASKDISVRGVRGEILLLHAPGFKLHCAIRLLHPRWRVYIVPRPGDQIVVGATEIESEDLSPISVQSTMELLSAAFSIFPALAEARILSTDVNIRPATPDNLPLIDYQEGLLRINGLFRHGWLLAPAVVEKALSEAQIQ